MRSVTNEKIAERNAKIGKYASTAGLIILVGVVIVNFYLMGQTEIDPVQLSLLLAGTLIGFAVNSVGSAYTQQWGRRSHLGLSQALKGLDNRYTLYNYRLGANHVLLGPHGTTILLPKYQPGSVTYTERPGKARGNKPASPRGEWRAPATRKLGGFVNADPIGDPIADVALEVAQLNKFLNKRAPAVALAPQAVIVFMHPRAEISAKAAPLPAMHIKQLKDYIRRLPRDGTFAPEKTAAQLEDQLGLTAAAIETDNP